MDTAPDPAFVAIAQKLKDELANISDIQPGKKYRMEIPLQDFTLKERASVANYIWLLFASIGCIPKLEGLQWQTFSIETILDHAAITISWSRT